MATPSAHRFAKQQITGRLRCLWPSKPYIASALALGLALITVSPPALCQSTRARGNDAAAMEALMRGMLQLWEVTTKDSEERDRQKAEAAEKAAVAEAERQRAKADQEKREASWLTRQVALAESDPDLNPFSKTASAVDRPVTPERSVQSQSTSTGKRPTAPPVRPRQSGS